MFEDLALRKIQQTNTKRINYRNTIGNILLKKIAQSPRSTEALTAVNDYSSYFNNVHFEAELIDLSWKKIIKNFNKTKLFECWEELKPVNVKRFALCFESKLFGKTVLHNYTGGSDIYTKVLVYDTKNNQPLIIQKLDDFLTSVIV